MKKIQPDRPLKYLGDKNDQTDRPTQVAHRTPQQKSLNTDFFSKANISRVSISSRLVNRSEVISNIVKQIIDINSYTRLSNHKQRKN